MSFVGMFMNQQWYRLPLPESRIRIILAALGNPKMQV